VSDQRHCSTAEDVTQRSNTLPPEEIWISCESSENFTSAERGSRSQPLEINVIVIERSISSRRAIDQRLQIWRSSEMRLPCSYTTSLADGDVSTVLSDVIDTWHRQWPCFSMFTCAKWSEQSRPRSPLLGKSSTTISGSLP